MLPRPVSVHQMNWVTLNVMRDKILTQAGKLKSISGVYDVNVGLQLKPTASYVLIMHCHGILKYSLDLFGVLIKNCTCGQNNKCLLENKF